MVPAMLRADQDLLIKAIAESSCFLKSLALATQRNPGPLKALGRPATMLEQPATVLGRPATVLVQSSALLHNAEGWEEAHP